ncbi:MAG: hypothetical protein K8S25_11470 [Alphaproteobacteria bacterium]|nr:hypothetical protein [Alphaproteobacteria bacterium]
MPEAPSSHPCDVRIERLWPACPAVDIGERAATATLPDEIVFIDRNDEPALRLHIYYPAQEYHLKTRVEIWQGWIVVGFGARVVLVSLRDSTQHTIALSDSHPPVSLDYFCRIETAPAHLLVTSGRRVLRIDANAQLLWKSPHVGLDGVVISHTDSSGIVHGSGEWDPPGGWRDFQLSLETGLLVPSRG